jgi:hypothetical protein
VTGVGRFGTRGKVFSIANWWSSGMLLQASSTTTTE